MDFGNMIGYKARDPGDRAISSFCAAAGCWLLLLLLAAVTATLACI
jgi:hypothetical protein